MDDLEKEICKSISKYSSFSLQEIENIYRCSKSFDCLIQVLELAQRFAVSPFEAYSRREELSKLHKALIKKIVDDAQRKNEKGWAG